MSTANENESSSSQNADDGLSNIMCSCSLTKIPDQLEVKLGPLKTKVPCVFDPPE